MSKPHSSAANKVVAVPLDLSPVADIHAWIEKE